MLWVFIILFVIPTVFYVVLRSSTVQTFLTQKITNYVSKKYKVEIYVGGVDIGLFDKVILEDLYVEDLKGDTLIFVNKFKVSIGKFRLRSNYIQAKKITLSKAFVNLYSDENEVLNLQQFLDKFSTDNAQEDTTASSTWIVECRTFDLDNIKFAYRTFQPDTVPYGMNFTDLMLDSINGQISKLNFGDTISLKVNQLSLRDKCGFKLDSLIAEIGMNETSVILDTFMLQTPHTKLNSNQLNLNFDNFDAFSDFLTKVKMDVGIIDSSYLSTKDIAYFVPELKGFDQRMGLKGNINGTVSSLNAKDLLVTYGENTSLLTNFNINGLPDVEQTFMYIDIQQLAVDPRDLRQIKLPPFNEEHYVEIPDMLNSIGTIYYNASFYGLVTDFVVDGELNSSIGKIETDLRLFPDKKKTGKLNFSGELITQKLQLSPFAEGLEGEMSMQFNLNGSQEKDGKLMALLEGEFSEVRINKYYVQKILLNGELDDKKFDGSIEVADNHLSMILVGLFDFTNKLPVMNFNGELRNLNLHRLNLVKEDSTANIGFIVAANLVGDNINNITGFAEISDARIRKQGDDLQLGKINLSIDDIGENEKEARIDSDIIEMSLTGSYNYETLVSSINSLIYNYLPSLKEEEDKVVKPKPETVVHQFNNFTVDVVFKNTQPIFDIIPLNVSISEGSSILANYDSEVSNFTLKVDSKKITYNDLFIENFTLFSNNDEKNINLKVETERIFLTDNRYIGNFEINSQIQNDSVIFDVDWDNQKAVKNYKGSLKTLTTLHRPLDSFGKMIPKKLITDIRIKPTSIVLSDTLWQIKPSFIHIDSSFVNIKNFMIAYSDQSFGLNGKISKHNTDTAFLNLKNIDLSYLNLVTEKSGFIFGGRLSGDFQVSNIYDTLIFYSNAHIDSLKVNKENFGNTNLLALWNDALQKLHIKSTTGLKHKNNLYIEGDFYPNTGVLDFDSIELSFLPLKIFQPFAVGIVSDLTGNGQGSLKLKGTISKPELSGKISLTKTAFLLDYLNTKYNLGKTVIRIQPNEIVIDSTVINSYKTGKAYTSMRMTHNNFSDLSFLLKMKADTFKLLNTNEFQNEYFYGEAYATGVITVEGNSDNITINASVKSEAKTHISIPLSSSSEVSETNDFIRFIQINNENVTKLTRDYEVDMSGLVMNFNLQVTPDARLELIFDKKVGDIIQADGNGNIRMLINSQGDFNMFGDYTIEDGDYLFTLKNIINKRLQVKSGGTLKWNGDPYNAQIDITAAYLANKVPVYDLMLDESMREVFVPVECNLMMQENLMNPKITFGIKLPSERDANNSTISTQLESLPEDELNKQILSLLIINRFQPLPGQVQSGINLEAGVSTNAYEVLSNQLNHWLSQISKDFDLGVKYTPGSQLSSAQMEMMFKTQFFNNRLILNGNLGATNFSNDASAGAGKGSSNSIVGDGELEYKITKNGKLRSKYFIKTNDDQLFYDSYITQGVGIMYKHEFDLDYNEAIRAFFEKIGNK